MGVDGSANAAQAEYWNGDVGRRWVRNQEQLDRAFRPLTAALLERAAARPGERAIDVGCGCGDTALALAGQVGRDGAVLAVDVSRPMLDRARERAAGPAAGRAPIEWVLADAAGHRFPPGGFDLVASRFGVMFFADPVAAFANLRRALRPDGRLAVLCWRAPGDNPWIAVPREPVLRVVPPPAPVPPDAPGPFAFADAARVGAILARAGFADVRGEAVDAPVVLGASPDGSNADALDAAARFAVETSPVAALLRDAPDATLAAARAGVLDALAPFARDGAVALGAACTVFTARGA